MTSRRSADGTSALPRPRPGTTDAVPRPRRTTEPRPSPSPEPSAGPPSAGPLIGPGLPGRPAPRDLAVIEASLAAVRQRPVVLAESFYGHLFEIAPSARAMFAPDLTDQMQRMTDLLLAALAGLRDEGAAVPRPGDPLPPLERSLHVLCAVHRDRWNVLPAHYRSIPHALTGMPLADDPASAQV